LPHVLRTGGLDPVLHQRWRHDVVGVQERGPVEPDVDEGGLHAGKHARHLALVDVADQATPVRALEEHFLQHAVLDQRSAALARRDVDQQLGAHRP
jgi:hypothetical protein